MVRPHRQRLALGQYPVVITLHNNPTRRWLTSYSSSTELRVNGTTPERSVASGEERRQWLDDPRTSVVTLELLAELCDVPRPAYVHLLYHSNTPLLWTTSFGVTDEGRITARTPTGRIVRTTTALRWPNAVEPDAHQLLLCDGFLVPTKDYGGVYQWDWQRKPLAQPVRLTPPAERWFYHRAVRVGHAILSARCRISANGLVQTGQLVWLQQEHDDDDDSTWHTHVLTTGPDVMFAVADMDPTDGCIEVLASEFFGQRVVLYSIRPGPHPQVVFQRVIDDTCGKAYACILANLQLDRRHRSTLPHVVVDAGSTVECLHPGDAFSHVLVTSHECSNEGEQGGGGGSLFSYEVPTGSKDAWRTQPWVRRTMAAGFLVNGKLNNMINPGTSWFRFTQKILGPLSTPMHSRNYSFTKLRIYCRRF